jgi:hypothetical protein
MIYIYRVLKIKEQTCVFYWDGYIWVGNPDEARGYHVLPKSEMPKGWTGVTTK